MFQIYIAFIPLLILFPLCVIHPWMDLVIGFTKLYGFDYSNLT